MGSEAEHVRAPPLPLTIDHSSGPQPRVSLTLTPNPALLQVGKKQGKTVIFVKDVPGFYVNRCLGPYLVETSALIQSGVPLLQLDQAMKDYGFPVGPITLADEVRRGWGWS